MQAVRTEKDRPRVVVSRRTRTRLAALGHGVVTSRRAPAEGQMPLYDLDQDAMPEHTDVLVAGLALAAFAAQPRRPRPPAG